MSGAHAAAQTGSHSHHNDLVVIYDREKEHEELTIIRKTAKSAQYGTGKIVVGVNPKEKVVSYIAVSRLFIDKGMNLSELEANVKKHIADVSKPGNVHTRFYEECWNKPTGFGVGGCVWEKFVNWILS